MPKVLNIRKQGIPEGAILCDRTTIYGNPYLIIPNFRNRQEACDLFEEHIEQIAERRGWNKEDLRGHNLVCWCAPQPCHCDTIIIWAN